MTRAIAIILILLVLVQIALLEFLRDDGVERGVLTIGEPFPALELVAVSNSGRGESEIVNDNPAAPRRIDSREAMGAHVGCSLVVIASRYCGICLNMRETWQREVDAWSPSFALPIRSYWLFLDAPESLSDFTDHPDMERTSILSIVGPGSRPTARLLGVAGTPTIFLLDKKGVLRMGVMGDLLPPASDAARWC